MKMKKRLAALSVPFLTVANKVMAFDYTEAVGTAKTEMDSNFTLMVPVGIGIVVGIAGFALFQRFIKSK